MVGVLPVPGTENSQLVLLQHGLLIPTAATADKEQTTWGLPFCPASSKSMPGASAPLINPFLSYCMIV